MTDVGQAYSAVADLYIRLFGTIDQVDPDDAAFIVRHLAFRPGRVLDLGCGPGHLTDHLRSQGADAIGIDQVPEFIAHARAAYPTGEFHLGSIDCLDAADHSIAGILAWFSTIHLPPDEVGRLLTEFRRVLAPAGSLVIGFFEGAELTTFDHKVATAYRWPVDELAGLLARHGFAEVARHRNHGSGHRPCAALAATA